MPQVMEPEITDASSRKRRMPSRIGDLPAPRLTPEGEAVAQVFANPSIMFLGAVAASHGFHAGLRISWALVGGKATARETFVSGCFILSILSVVIALLGMAVVAGAHRLDEDEVPRALMRVLPVSAPAVERP